MSNLSAYHLKKLDDLLNDGGYTPLIASSNAEFSAFFNNLGIDVYNKYGCGSKGRTLNNFFREAPNDEVSKVLLEVKSILNYEYSNNELELSKINKLFEDINNKISNSDVFLNDELHINRCYTKIKELNPGGFADTYIVEDNRLNRKFVLKKFRWEFLKEEDNNKFFEKFKKEIEMLYDVIHTNIVRIYDYSLDERWYLMEYIEGISIEEYLKNNPNNIVSIFNQAINVFCYLEKLKLCHRDIRNNNILITNNGILKLIDFGFGKYLEGDNSKLNSATKVINYPYSLPDEIDCENPKYNIKTEIYCIGKIFEKIINDSSIDDFPYKEIIDKMTNKNPSYRYESFKQIRDIIFSEIKKDNIPMLSLKENYQELTNLLDNIISSKDEKSETFSLSVIIDNLEKLYNNNILNDVLDNNVFFANCFISKVMEYYPKKKTITLQYIHGLFNWLKQLTEEEKKQFEKCLTFKLNNYPTYVEDLPF